MKKADVIKRYQALLVELDEPARDVVLSAGGALVVLGLRESTADLDVDVQPNVFKWLARSHLTLSDPGVPDSIKYRLDVDVHALSETVGVVCVDGVWIYSPSELLKQKRYLASLPSRREGKRERDWFEVELLEQLIKEQTLTARVMA